MSRLIKPLLLTSAVFAAVIHAELASSVARFNGITATTPRPPTVQSAAQATVKQPPPAALGDTILARPLFSPRRRPVFKAALPLALRTVAPPRLSGIIMSGDQRKAIFAGENQRPVVAEPGGRVGEYVVERIEPERVTLTGPGGKRVIQPSFDPHRSERPASVAATQMQAPVAPASAIMPSLRNLAGFGGPPVAR